MIASASFVLLFVVVGAMVLFLAFGGGARGAREQLHAGQSRGGRRFATALIAVVIVGFGAVIPGLVIARNNESKAKRSTGGLKLSDAQEKGRKIFVQQCSTCHTLGAANAVGKVGPNLDRLASLDTTTAAVALVTDAINVGRARGRGQMPAQLVTGQDVRLVAKFVAAAHGR